MYCWQSVLLLLLFLLFLQDDRVYSPKRQQNYTTSTKRNETEAKQAKQNGKENTKQKFTVYMFIYCTCHCHHGTSPMNQMCFFFDFFLVVAQNVKKPLVTFVMKNVHIIITFPLNKVVHWVFRVFSSFSHRHFADVVSLVCFFHHCTLYLNITRLYAVHWMQKLCNFNRAKTKFRNNQRK